MYLYYFSKFYNFLGTLVAIIYLLDAFSFPNISSTKRFSGISLRLALLIVIVRFPPLRHCGTRSLTYARQFFALDLATTEDKRDKFNLFSFIYNGMHDNIYQLILHHVNNHKS